MTLRSSALVAVLIVSFSLGAVTGADAAPKFDEYPSPIYAGKRATVIDHAADTPSDDQLVGALTRPVDFGGRYVFVPKGAGTGCASGVIINVETGVVVPLPFANCFWAEGYERPFEFMADSRLFVVAGHVGEVDPAGEHYFRFDGRAFRYLSSRLPTGNEVVVAAFAETFGSAQAGNAAKP